MDPISEATQALTEAGRMFSAANVAKLEEQLAALRKLDYHPGAAAVIDRITEMLAAAPMPDPAKGRKRRKMAAAGAGDKTVMKEATVADLSWEDITERVEDAVFEKFGLYDPDDQPMIGMMSVRAQGDDECDCCIATYSDRVVFRKDEVLYSTPYTLTTGGMVQLGDATEVIARYESLAESAAATAALAATAVQILEAVAGSSGREWDVLLIEVGLSKNGKYYPPETLQAAVHLFEGAYAFADHPTDQERKDRPERSVKDKVGRFVEVAYGTVNVGGKLLEGLKARFKVIAPWLREGLMEAHSAGEPDFYGLSINAEGKVGRKQHGGRLVQWVEAITAVSSVDVVTDPSAGGRVTRLVASMGAGAEQEAAGEEGEHMDPTEMAALIRTQVAEAVTAAMPTLMTALKEANAPAAATTEAAAGLVEEVKALKEASRKADGRARLTEALAAAAISDVSKARIRASYTELLDRRDFTPEELTASITEAHTYEAALVQQFSNPRGVGAVRSGITVGAGMHDKYNLGLQGFFRGENVDGVPQFRSLREAYARWTGQDYLDVDPLQMISDFGAKYDSALSHKRLQESLTTASWGEIFADNLYVMMLRNYAASPYYNLWRMFVSEVEDVPDFQTRHWARTGGYGDLSTVAEQATYPALTSFADEEVTYAIAKRGGLDDATMEMLTYERGAQKVREIPRGMARAANRTLYKFVLNLITTDNPTMGYDSVALYNSAHGNTGTTALSLNGVDVTQRAMRDQTAYGESSEILGPRNKIKYLIVPNELEMRAQRIVNPSDGYFINMPDSATAAVGDSGTGIDPQAFKGKGIGVFVYDQLTDATDWWAVADPAEVNTMIIGFWRGQQEPELFVQDNPTVGSVFTADKISYKVRHVYSGVVSEHRSFYRQVVT